MTGHGPAVFGRRAAVAAALLLVACQRAPEDSAAVSADEARQLNEAAAMLDANSVSAAALDPPTDPQGDAR